MCYKKRAGQQNDLLAAAWWKDFLAVPHSHWLPLPIFFANSVQSWWSLYALDKDENSFRWGNAWSSQVFACQLESQLLHISLWEFCLHTGALLSIKPAPSQLQYHSCAALLFPNQSRLLVRTAFPLVNLPIPSVSHCWHYVQPGRYHCDVGCEQISTRHVGNPWCHLLLKSNVSLFAGRICTLLSHLSELQRRIPWRPSHTSGPPWSLHIGSPSSS